MGADEHTPGAADMEQAYTDGYRAGRSDQLAEDQARLSVAEQDIDGYRNDLTEVTGLIRNAIQWDPSGLIDWLDARDGAIELAGALAATLAAGNEASPGVPDDTTGKCEGARAGSVDGTGAATPVLTAAPGPALNDDTTDRLGQSDAGAGHDDEPGDDASVTDRVPAPAGSLEGERPEINVFVGETDSDALHRVADWLAADPNRVLIGLWSTASDEPLEVDLQVVTTVMPEGGE